MSGASGTNGARQSLLFSSAKHKVSRDKRKRRSERGTGLESAARRQIHEPRWREEAHLDIVAAAAAANAVSHVLCAAETQHVDMNDI